MKYLFKTLLCMWSVSAICSVHTTIPFKTIGKLIIIEAQVNGQTGNFILDTGSPVFVLNEALVKLDNTFSAGTSTGINGQKVELLAGRVDLYIGNGIWKKTEAKLLPLTKISQKKGIPVMGLLGNNLFDLIDIDWAKNQITLVRYSGKSQELDFEYNSNPEVIIPFRYKSGTPVIDLRIGEIPVSLAFDTGSEIQVIDQRIFRKLKNQLEIYRTSKVTGISNRQQTVSSGVLHNLNFEDFLFPSLPVVIINLDAYNWTTSGKLVDGMLGTDILEYFRVLINFKQNIIQLRSVDQLKELTVYENIIGVIRINKIF